MTNPSWCPACLEFCPDCLDGICTTCGEELQLANADEQSRSLVTQHRENDPLALAFLASSVPSTRIDRSALLPLVNQLRSIPIDSNEGTRNDGDISDLAALLPPEALNPQAGSSTQRPVSQSVLENLKRVVLTPQSAELFDAHVCLFQHRSIGDFSPCLAGEGVQTSLKLNAIPGEFGPRTARDTTIKEARSDDSKLPQRNTRNAALIVCSPRTTKGGLSAETLAEIAVLKRNRMPYIAYVERGDGITFVQKAIACQRAGEISDSKNQSLCIGVIVGNTAPGGAKEVWPYVMQDNSNEATKFGLRVPVVMIRRDDGMRLVQWASKSNTTDSTKHLLQYTPCQILVHAKHEHSHTCPVCTDPYVSGATIVRLPTCGHVFHESCALTWLRKHNTCPYCRKELPTEDEEYEVQRRRREARGSGESVTENGFGEHSFYG
ncbi:hypothetical protein HJC23_003961 [Cyclotella cryptica]|uniref:RING-type domain-containing protein n=1 Tax=Cyclotella cryptica TaxID=29204 RepID=A0ABD3QTU0_9STRA|eukprot:CCRYP_001923-RA/>CCRYP_001923-RA protein AED:0.09 eAED:0.09 QI:0/-1/0/1/-1/1/1/0/434